ncbi:MAG: hypothetical protein ACI4AB_12675 [Acetatifactor sp.]
MNIPVNIECGQAAVDCSAKQTGCDVADNIVGTRSILKNQKHCSCLEQFPDRNDSDRKTKTKQVGKPYILFFRPLLHKQAKESGCKDTEKKSSSKIYQFIIQPNFAEK